MAEYIEREALQKRLEMHQATNPATIGKKQFQEGYYLGLSEAEIMIAQAPKADVAEVRRGHWIGLEYDGFADGNPVYDLWECSACGEEVIGEDVPDTHLWCHNCGAKMDGW